MLLRHASRCGVKVHESTRVTDIEFDGPRPVAASYLNTSTHDAGRIEFDYLVDSSGRAGVMSTKYLKNRVFNPSFKNIATWGYWRGAKKYQPNDEKLANFPFFEALSGMSASPTNQSSVLTSAPSDDSGWAWFFPLHDGTTSVGLVMNQDIANRKKRAHSWSTREFYVQELKKQAPVLVDLIGPEGYLAEDGKSSGSAVRSASDYSYSAKCYAGPGYRLVGDAACEFLIVVGSSLSRADGIRS